MHMNTSQPQLYQLYKKVIDEFGKRLLQKYNQKQQGFDSQMVDQMKTLILQKMSRPDLLFPKALQIKHGATSNQLVIDKKISITNNNNNQIKKQQVQSHHHHHHHHNTNNNNNNTHNNNGSSNNNREGEQDIDYAGIFDHNEIQVKKQQGDQNGVIKHQPNDDLDDEKDQQDQKQKKQKVTKIKNNLTIHIVGTYQPRAKRHVARDQSTSLTLQNVFIKVRNKPQEIFVPRLTCQFRKQ